jgi:hypothetical protein
MISSLNNIKKTVEQRLKKRKRKVEKRERKIKKIKEKGKKKVEKSIHHVLNRLFRRYSSLL